jgi:hypothetical protein
MLAMSLLAGCASTESSDDEPAQYLGKNIKDVTA